MDIAITATVVFAIAAFGVFVLLVGIIGDAVARHLNGGND